MFVGGIVSAAGWYADVALAALLVLFLLAGIIKGFSRSTKGFFVFVFIVCVSLLLTGLTQEPSTSPSSRAMTASSTSWWATA